MTILFVIFMVLFMAMILAIEFVLSFYLIVALSWAVIILGVVFLILSTED